MAIKVRRQFYFNPFIFCSLKACDNFSLIKIGGSKKSRLFAGLQSCLLGSLVRLLGQENSLDVGENSTLSDGDSSKKLVQLLVVPDGQLEMSWDDPGLLVVSGGVASQLKNLSSEVLHDSSQVDRGSSSNTSGVVSLPQQTMNTSNRELKSSSGGPALGLSLNLSTFTTSGHFESLKLEFKLMASVSGSACYISSPDS